MPDTWMNRPLSEGFRVRPRNPKSKIDAMNVVLLDKAQKKAFWDNWSPELLKWFTQSVESGYRCLNGSELSPEFEGNWVHCSSCKSVHRPIPGIGSCLDCGSDPGVPLENDTLRFW